MKSANITVTCLVFLLLEILVAPRIALGRISPDFMLLLAAYFAVQRKPEQAAIAGFLVGLFQDLANPELLGLNALTKTLVGYGLGVVGSKAESENPFFLMTILGITAVLHDFVYLLFFTGLHMSSFLVLWTTVSIPSAIYTAVAGLISFRMAATLGSKAARSIGKARF